MAWNWMTGLARVSPAGVHFEPVIGPGGLSYRQAHEVIHVTLADLRAWELLALRRVGAQDDLVFSGSALFCVYEHEVDQAVPAVQEWLRELMDRQADFDGEVMIAEPRCHSDR